MQELIQSYFGNEQITKIEPLAQAGSSRKYFRIFLQNNQTAIVCENANVAENRTYFYLTSIFKKHQINVPTIFHISENEQQYILEDLGNESLLDYVLKNKEESLQEIVYRQAIDGLIHIQTKLGNDIDYSQCFAAKSFDETAVIADFHYCKYYFLDIHGLQYDKQNFQNEIESFAREMIDPDTSNFMYRDFQGRNVMLKNGQPYFIDFQGGMKGPFQYDIASLLWQAKANLSSRFKEKLYNYYFEKLSKMIPINEAEFHNKYAKIVLLRLLQVLGAYGLRGIIEQKHHFVSSIPFALKNIEEWHRQFHESIAAYPTIRQIVLQLLSTELKEKYSTKELKTTSKLTITVQSFSFKKGLPADTSGNGGGYVFDCRGILNPGRFDEYKKLTGRDQAVIDFLETKTKINDFLYHIQKVISISIEDYIQRDFENLIISFGCTGGQHRSVYCADQIGKFIREHYPVQVQVKHIVQDANNWKID